MVERRRGAVRRRPTTRAVAGIAPAAVSLAVLAAGCGLVVPDDDAFPGGTSEQPPGGSGGGRARNVILFIGDGMGANHRAAGRLAGVGLDGRLAMDSLPYAGLAQTDAGDHGTFVTDSAAAGTSLASGVKTSKGAIGTDVDKEPVPTLVEVAEEAGMATGLVTTGPVTDATTAAFGAHVEHRSEQSEIARQYVEETGVDVLLGGGEDYWYPEDDEGAFPDEPDMDPDEGSRGEEGDLVERATEDLGYTYVSSAEELEDADGDRLLGLFANQDMFQRAPEGEGDVYDPVVSLEEMTRTAIEVLSRDPDGFLLVVEEEAVDGMAHANNARRVIDAVLALDEAVAAGLEFAADDGDTLVVVTADHETGGLAVEDAGESIGSGEDGPFEIADSEFSFVVDWTTRRHTNADVPVTALGPGAQALTGIYENTHIHGVLLDAIGGGTVEDGDGDR